MSHLNRWKGRHRTWQYMANFKNGSMLEGRFRRSVPLTEEEATLEAIECACKFAKRINKLHKVKDAHSKRNLRIIIVPIPDNTDISKCLSKEKMLQYISLVGTD